MSDKGPTKIVQNTPREKKKKLPFRQRSLEERKLKFEQLKTSFPEKLPVVAVKAKNCTLTVNDEFKFVVDKTILGNGFMTKIKGYQKLDDNQILFITVLGKNKKITLNLDANIGKVYDKHKQEDGFLYFEYSNLDSLG